MFEKWIAISPSALLMIAINVLFVYAAIIFYCRVTGLRSFSKMSAPDFAMTVAVGSLFAATISSPSPTLFAGLFSLAMLFTWQWFFAFLRRHISGAADIIDNKPLLLMQGSKILEDNLDRANITKSDIYGKLREANVFNFDQIKAVVFEITGDVVVLHSNGDHPRLDDEILADVEGWNHEE